VFTLTKSFDDKSEVEESKEENIEFFESGEDSTEALEAAEEPLDLVALGVEGTIVGPGILAVGLGRDDGDHAEFEDELASLIPLISAVHDQRKPFWHRRQFA